MNEVWAAVWASAGEDELEAMGTLLKRLRADGDVVRLILCLETESEAPGEFLRWMGLEAGTFVVAIRVQAHPRATLREQNPAHPDYPDTILAPYASASKRLEAMVGRWLAEFGAPRILLVPSTDGLGYFTFHRAWRDPEYLRGTRLALLERPGRRARADMAGEPLYRRDHYWIHRMEAFCAAAATAVHPSGAVVVEVEGDPAERCHGRRFPVADSFPATVPVAGAGNGRLTVVIPYHNMAEWLGEAIDSVLQAEAHVAEVLIIDDGSDAPGSADALAEQAARSERIRVIRQENRGLGRTRMRGVEEAGGEFVFFLDADDAVLPQFFAEAVGLLKRFENIGMVTAWEQYTGRTRKVWPKWDADIPWMLGMNMTTPMVMVRRVAWLSAVRWSPAFSENFEDYDAWLSLLEDGWRFLCIPEVRLRHRIRPDSRWERRTPGQIRRLKAALVEKHAPLYRAHAVDLAGLLAANGPGANWDTPGAFHDLHPRSPSGEMRPS